MKIVTLTTSMLGADFEHRLLTINNIPTRYCELALMEIDFTLTEPAIGQYLFVYCDIIHPHLLGDTLAHLLRVIPLTPGDVTHNWIAANPYYFPVSKDVVDSVCLYLRDEFGEPINIISRSLQATFNIRKRL